jgi:hypothetical protein
MMLLHAPCDGAGRCWTEQKECLGAYVGVNGVAGQKTDVDRVPAIPEQKATRTSVNPPNFGPKPDRNQTVTV